MMLSVKLIFLYMLVLSLQVYSFVRIPTVFIKMIKFFGNHGSCGIADEPNYSKVASTAHSCGKLFRRLAIMSLFLPFPGLASDLQLPVISDEVSVSIQSPYLGIGLQELRYKNNYRVVVSNIKENAASEVQQKLREGMILTEVNQLDIEGYSIDQVAKALKSDTRPIQLTFRDPDVLFKCLVANDPGIYRTTMVPTVLSPNHHQQFLYVANYPQQHLRSERQAAAMGSVLEVRLRSQMVSAAQAEEMLAKEPVQQKETGDEGQLDIKDAGTVVYFVLGADKPSGKFITISDSAEGDKSAAATVTEMLDRVWQDWDRLLVGMRPGDRRVLVLPASMMDKTTASGDSDQMIVLDVRLLSIDGDIDEESS